MKSPSPQSIPSRLRRGASAFALAAFPFLSISAAEIHHYAFEDDLTDSIGSAGGTGTNTSFIDGYENRAVQFASNGKIERAALSVADTVSIATWVYIDSESLTKPTFFANGDETSALDGFVFRYNTNSLQLELITGNGSDSAEANSLSANLIDGWHHVAAVIDRTGGNATLYVNGSDVTASAALRSDFALDGAVVFGATPDGRNHWELDGALDELRIFDHALSLSEVQALAGVTATPPDAPTGLTADPVVSQVSLSWEHLAEPGTTYNVYRSETSGSGHILVGPDVEIDYYHDMALEGGKTYYYQVTAEHGGMESEPSNEVEAVLPPQFVFDDSDEDGLDDAWEQLIIDADPSDAITTLEEVVGEDDFDGDGQDNKMEHLAGTLGHDPNSHIAVRLQHDGTSPKFNYTPHVNGRRYDLERSVDLSTWNYAGTVNETGVGDENREVDLAAVAEEAMEFYRLRMDRPNFLFILSDDLGFQDLGVYGHPYMDTPNLDQLASEGTRYEHFYASAAVCHPSRSVFMGGRYLPTGYSGVHSPDNVSIRPGVVTVTKWLQNAGYVTAFIGKWHLNDDVNARHADKYGIDYYQDTDLQQFGNAQADPWNDQGNGQSDQRNARLLANFIKAHKHRPFYAVLSTQVPHTGINPPQYYRDLFADLEPDPADFPAGSFTREHFELRQAALAGGPAEATWETQMRNWVANIKSHDVTIGELLQVLEDEGIADNTVVFYTSDNGPSPTERFTPDVKIDRTDNTTGSAGQYYGSKMTFFEGGTCVPAIVRWPGKVAAGHIDTETVWTAADWLPTVCALAGVSLGDYYVDGMDVSLNWMQHPNAPDSVNRTFVWGRQTREMAIREGYWKYYEHNGKKEQWLFDLENDPYETNNLAEVETTRRDAMQARLQVWREKLEQSLADGDRESRRW